MNRPPEHWIETLRNFALELGFDTFVFWPEEEPLVQIQRFVEEVVQPFVADFGSPRPGAPPRGGEARSSVRARARGGHATRTIDLEEREGNVEGLADVL